MTWPRAQIILRPTLEAGSVGFQAGSTKSGGKALTRSFKPISNRFVREWIEANLPDGCDGELMLRGGTFNQTISAAQFRSLVLLPMALRVIPQRPLAHLNKVDKS